MVRIAMAALGIGLLAAPAAAAPAVGGPNIFGVKGLVTIPSAKTLPEHEVAAHVHFGDDFLSYGGSFGLMDRLEVGASFLRIFEGNPLGLTPRVVVRDGQVVEIKSRPVTIVNAKYALWKEGKIMPGVSVGVVDAFDQLDVAPSFYAVASKQIVVPTPLREWSFSAHAGIGSGIYDQEPFVGAELGLGFPFTLLTFGLPVSVLADWSDGEVSAAGRIAFPLGFGAEVGLLRGDAVYGAATWRRRF